MGVEIGMPDCQVKCVESTLPAFIRPVRLQVAEGDEDGFVEESLAVEPQPERPENHNFMPRALQVPGACHAIHNACLNLDDALSEFDWFFTSLKKLDALIGNKRRRERFVQVVLTGTPLYEAGQKVLESFRSTLHKERWGELAGYLSDGLPILIFLRQHWDPVAYSRGLQEDAVEGDEFSCRGITELLKDEYFCAYWHMQLQLRDVVRSLLRWVEGCSCHSNLLSGVPPHRQQTQLRREISCPREVACRCPVMGCRAADMAAGQLLHFAESVFSLRFADFASALQNPLSVDAWGRLRQEWSKAAAFVCENLKIRLGFYQSLPWIILGGTHADPAKARKCLQEAQSLWHDLPEDARSMQHVMAQELFSPGPLRDDLQRFVSDCEPLNACPRLEEYLAPLTFVQIAERIIEGAHKDLGTLPKRHSMTALSIQLRAPELNRSLPLKPDSFESLLEQFVIARKVRRFSDVFPCFKAHPLFQALARQRRRAPSRAHLKVLRSILYRDATVQHGDLRESVQWHKSQKKLLDQAKLAFVPKEPKLSQALLYAQAGIAYVRSTCAQDSSAVLSIEDRFYAPLILRPSGIRQPSHAPCTIAAMGKHDILVTRLENFGVSALPDGPGGEVLNLCEHVNTLGLDAFLAKTQLWRRPGNVQLALPGIEGASPADVCQLLERMVESNALAGCNFGVVPVRGSREELALQALLEEGLAEESGFGARLTANGVASLRFRHSLDSPQPLNQARSLPLLELDVMELMAIMKSQGWEWSLLPAQAAKRRELRYSLGNPLQWYTAGVSVNKSYLLCLLNAEKLKEEHDIQSIPHALPAEAYESILTGMQPQAAVQALLDRPRKGRKRASLSRRGREC